MPLETDTEYDGNFELIYVFDVETPETKRLVYKIDTENKIVQFIPDPESSLRSIKKFTMEGFSSLPKEFNDVGYLKTGNLQYYLAKAFEEKDVRYVMISKTRQSSFAQYYGAYRVILNYKDFQQLRNRIVEINTSAQNEKRLAFQEMMHNLFPRTFDKVEATAKSRAKRVVANLDEAIIDHFGPEDTEKLLDFVEQFLKKRYSDASHRLNLFSAAKIKVDKVALNDLIAKFEKLMQQDPAESKWSEFLERNLFFVESRYVSIIQKLNVSLAGAREVDFGLVDSQGYLDIFEIKKPSTSLLAASVDRGNYYWSTDAIKAIVQAEKYLFNADAKRNDLAADIRRNRNVDVKVIRPRAVLVMGDTSQLDNENKREDFRVLRMSLKNVEIITYDELLDRLKNQSQKVYISSDEEAES